MAEACGEEASKRGDLKIANTSVKKSRNGENRRCLKFAPVHRSRPSQLELRLRRRILYIMCEVYCESVGESLHGLRILFRMK